MARPEGLWVLEGLLKCRSLGVWRHFRMGVALDVSLGGGVCKLRCGLEQG